MRAIILDSVASTAKVIDIDLSGDEGYKRISEAIGCEYFTAVKIKSHKGGMMETAYCDDIGAINGTRTGILHHSYGPIYGNVLILGTNAAGESVDSKLTLEELEDNNIAFSFKVDDDDMVNLTKLNLVESK